MMGVWMEDESTVTTVSQGISRPNGANTALSLFGWAIPAELSANKLIGESVDVWFAGTSGSGDGFVKAGDDDDGDGDNDDGKSVGSDLGDGGLKACIGRTTDRTTCGLSVALVANAVTLTASSADV
jgi:hypothetical protein